MNLKDIIKKILETKSTDPVKKGIEQVEKSIEKAEDDEAIKSGAKTAYKSFESSTKKMSPDEKGQFAQEFANSLVAKEEIPQDVAVQFINSMIKEDEVANEYVIEAAKDLPDKKIVTLVGTTEMPIEDRKELIGAVTDDEIRREEKEKIKKEERKREEKCRKREIEKLKKIYSMCNGKIGDLELVEKVQEVINKSKYLSKHEIEAFKIRIVARKIAYNVNEFGNSKLAYLSQLLSIKDMKRVGIIDLAKKEYESIKEKRKKFRRQYITEMIEKYSQDEDKSDSQEDKLNSNIYRYKNDDGR